MNLQDRYVNPFTDFGFKKLFGSEPNKEFLIDFLNTLLPENHKIEDLTYTKNEYLGGNANLQNRPQKLQERIFEKFFRLAEIANFTKEEQEIYVDSLKYYRDMKNVVDTSFVEGRKQEKIEIALKMLEKGINLIDISEMTGLSIKEIKELKK